MAQRAVVREIARQGQDEPRRYVRAAYATGIVESHLQNLAGGHADSAGWRQERRSLYPNPRNIRASVRRFYKEAAQHDHGQSAAQLAADVQRPAAQYRGRYGEVMGQARAMTRRQLARSDDGMGSFGSPSMTGVRSVRGPQLIPGGRNDDFDAALLDALLSPHKPGQLVQAVMRNLDSGAYTTETPTRVKPTKIKYGLREGSQVAGAADAGVRPTGKGRWGGSRLVANVARDVARANGYPNATGKRTPSQNAAVGGSPTSDHLTTDQDSFAWDLSNGTTSENERGHSTARKIARKYGVRYVPNSYESGGVASIGGRKFKVQILYGNRINHGDHIHVGITAL